VQRCEACLRAHSLQASLPAVRVRSSSAAVTTRCVSDATSEGSVTTRTTKDESRTSTTEVQTACLLVNAMGTMHQAKRARDPQACGRAESGWRQRAQSCCLGSTHLRVESGTHLWIVAGRHTHAEWLHRVLAVAPASGLVTSDVRSVQRRCRCLPHAQRLRAASSDVRAAALQHHRQHRLPHTAGPRAATPTPRTAERSPAKPASGLALPHSAVQTSRTAPGAARTSYSIEQRSTRTRPPLLLPR